VCAWVTVLRSPMVKWQMFRVVCIRSHNFVKDDAIAIMHGRQRQNKFSLESGCIWALMSVSHTGLLAV